MQEQQQQQQELSDTAVQQVQQAAEHHALNSQTGWQAIQTGQQEHQYQPGWEQHHSGRQQLGRGYLMVLRAMATVVKRSWHAWADVLLRVRSMGHSTVSIGRSSSSSSSQHQPWKEAASYGDGAVGSTPYWLEPTNEDGDDDGTQHDDDGAAADNADAQYSYSSSSSLTHMGRHLQQSFQTPDAACSKQVPWLYGLDKPMLSVDWLRQGVVQPGSRDQGNCSNSFVWVAAALAESTMALQGYTGSAKRISEAQLMACVPGANCSRAGTTHVVLNSLACGAFAAAGSGPNAFPISDPNKAAKKPAVCSAADFNPVETGITGWSFVPPTELAFAQALSRTPIKVAVDATMLQSYRAGFIGCNVKSSITNHAVLAVGYSQRVRVTPQPQQTASSGQRSFTYFTGGEYWMLRNSWGTQGSVDGFVYVAKGCGTGNVAPLGLLANRGAMPLFNTSDTYGVGRLQCYFPGDSPDPGCDKNLLLKLSSFCAKVEDFLPLKARTNCSCSCIPV